MVDRKVFLVAAGVFCCLLIVSVSIAVPLSIRAEESCSNEKFHDLPNEFWVEEQWFSMRARSEIYDKNQKVIGSYTTKPLGTSTKYRYRDLNDNVVGKADKGFFRFTYDVSHCLEEEGDKYELEREFLTIGKVEYDLRKNGKLLGSPTKKTWFTCNPDVILVDLKGKVLASIDRSCGESWFKDKWHIVNHQPGVVDNYVLGFLGYITTQYENEKSSSTNDDD